MERSQKHVVGGGWLMRNYRDQKKLKDPIYFIQKFQVPPFRNSIISAPPPPPPRHPFTHTGTHTPNPTLSSKSS